MSAPPRKLKSALVANYFRFATPEDVPPTAAAREALALSHLRWGMRRESNQIMVRAFNPVSTGTDSSHTVIETITDDSPFIIDSLTMQLNEISQGVLVKLHTVLLNERDESGKLLACSRPSTQESSSASNHAQAESWTHFEIPRVLDAGELKEIERRLKATLQDVRCAVRDWPRMRDLLRLASRDLKSFGKGSDVLESAELLDWIADDHFTLLGCCTLPKLPGSTPLGLLRAAGRRNKLRTGARRGKGMAQASLTISKAPIRSTVHRPALLDDIRIDAYDSVGRIVGEHRVLGLFTSIAYNENPGDIPLLRAKIFEVLRRSELQPSSHRGKALRHILDTFPRDELIQASIADLERIGIGVLNLDERRKIRLFVSKSAYSDFLSCLVYLPRDGYSTRARRRVEAALQDFLNGTLVDSQLAISESTLARLAVKIQLSNPSARLPNLEKLERQLADVAIAWIDRARLALLDSFSEQEALELHRQFVGVFPIDYQESASTKRISRDFAALKQISSSGQTAHYELDAKGTRATFSLFVRESTVPLYVTNPILENMGVRLLQEKSYELNTQGMIVRIQDFMVESTHGESLESESIATRFKECFAHTLDGRIENDGFNQLIISAGLDWRETVILRAYCKYLLQCRTQFSQAYIVDTLRRHPEVVRAFTAMFDAYFNPNLKLRARSRALKSVSATINEGLNKTTNLDDDRILRLFNAAIRATLRTNRFQLSDGAPKTYLSLKLDPSLIPGMPEPRPKFEIFVYSPRVEGVHLRGGRLARGGLRWSDRREDFRTEVLGLMKAQQVKNTVIVPAGAKGGFVLKDAPTDRDALSTRVIECYRTFLAGLLDLTDNIVENQTIPPEATVCRDPPDPYLVVAADKGTATFSDTANSVAEEYGFWLGDAFASGGSAGYDHKKMGITARGAWESVKRHFREIGIDTQVETFTVVGIGDMSGDVFGNGMLLSKHIQLIGAFNHRHIFIDPTPDSERSFEERQRLFAMARCGWDDYNPALLSKGGGIYDRQSKSIRLSPEARTALAVKDEQLTPPELISLLLKAPVDLLWNGGIGTYVKASSESHGDAADPTNDAVRVDGNALRAKVVAEGGNLGLTQRGRIEFALAGGRINTDFIDNSAGVDSSDREVNIKILLNDAIRRKALAKGQRNALLKAMTAEVADLVLASNYAQTEALSIMVTKAHERLGEHARLIRILESRGILDRAREFLPGEEEIDERKRAGKGFTRPSFAVILSYAKIELFESLVGSDIPDEAHCQSEVVEYFPKRLGKRFAKSIASHRLRREIAAMLITSSMINRMGPFFALRAENDTGGDAEDVARAYAITRGLFSTRSLWQSIEDLDGKVPAQVQYECFYECSRMIRRAVYWFLHRRERYQNIELSINQQRKGVSRVLDNLSDALCGWSRRSHDRDVSEFQAIGVPATLAQRIASLRLLTQVLDIAEIARELDLDPGIVTRLHFELGRGLRLDWIREQIELLRVEGQWRALARGTLRETLGREHQALLQNILQSAGSRGHEQALSEWLAASNARVTRLKRTLDEMQASGQMDFATLSIALKEVGRLR